MTFVEIFNMVGRTVKINPNSASKIDSIVLRCTTDIYIKQMEIEANKDNEVYKKALDLACYEISATSGDTTESLTSFYMQKARNEEWKQNRK